MSLPSGIFQESYGQDMAIFRTRTHWILLLAFLALLFTLIVLSAGIKIYRYTEGFLHQKVLLVDDDVSGVGTANLDNRSFRLNFEITAVVSDQTFAQQMEKMLLADFRRARLMTQQELAEKPFWFRVGARAAYLSAPVQ